MSGRHGDPLAERDFFVGRDDELAALRDLLTRLSAGTGGAVLIEGEQGAGKSALLREALADAAVHGFRLGWGTTGELGQRIPLLLIRECLDGARAARPGDAEPRRPDGGTCRTAAGPSPSPGQAPPADPVQAETGRLLAEVERLCARSRVVLVTEDLQWADRASLRLWRSLAQAAGRLPLLLAGTCRPVPAGAELTGLRSGLLAGEGRVLSLGPLPDGQLPALVARLAGARPGPRLAAELRSAGGNPRYVRELLDALVASGRVTVGRDTAELTAGPAPARLPAGLAALIAERLSALPRPTVTMLRWAAVLGDQCQVTDLETVTGLDTAVLAGQVHLAAAAGAVSEAGGTVTFRHGLVRRQLYEGVPPARLLHAQAARALAEAGAPAEQVAAQLAPSGEWTAEWVRAWLAGALPTLPLRVPAVAGQLLRAVTEATPESDPRWPRLQAGLVTAAFLSGRYDEARQAGRQLLATAPPAELAAEAGWLIAACLLRSGQPDQALAALGRVPAGPGGDGRWAARLGALRALALAAAGQSAEAAAAARAVLDAAPRDGDPLASGHALHALARVRLASRDTDGALRLTEQALAAAGHHDEAADLRLLLLADRVTVLGLLGRPADADGAAGSALAAADRPETPSVTVLRATLAAQWFEAGRWDDALSVLGPVAGWAPGAGSALAHGLSALIACYRDDGDAAASHLGALTEPELRAVTAVPGRHYPALARAVAGERAGQPALAASVLAECLAAGAATSVPAGHLLRPALVRAALAAGDPDTAAAVAAAAADEAAREPLLARTAAAGHCRGLLAADPAPVLAAAACHGSAGRLLRQAEALTDAAALLAGRGDLTPARERFDEAVALYRGMAAVWAVRAAAARLRGYGIRPRRPGYPARGTPGPATLTPAEAVIARLIAAGRSNPEIAAELSLSRNTVQTHVSHILAKLGARSRMEVAAALAGQREQRP